jgi:membrane-bound lytic murein transglycosylase MltF
MKCLALCALLAFGLPVAAPVRPVWAGPVVPWEEHFRTIAGEAWIERAAQVRAESGWNQNAVSPVGAMGPAQVMPSTLKWWKTMGWVSKQSTGFDIPECLRGQNAHMLWLRRYWTDLDHRLAAYNAGQGSILRADALAREMGWESDAAWLHKALPRITGAAHSKETQGYIVRNARFRSEIIAALAERGGL